jgi:hypothetical protein
MRTLLLNRDTWDLSIDAQGNIAVASEPYAQVQDVASSCRLFEGEAYYDTTLGVPYFEQILGHFQPIQVVKTALADAALRVPGVTTATVLLDAIVDRALSGQVQVTLDDGTVTTVTV